MGLRTRKLGVHYKLNAARRRALKWRLCGEQNWRCAYCAESLEFATATIDHVVPLDQGGSNEWDNLIIACWRCNHVRDTRHHLHYYLAHHATMPDADTIEHCLTYAGFRVSRR